MDEKVEKTRNVLELDLDDYPNAQFNPIGDARTYRKIQDYLYACILADMPKHESVDWLYGLYSSQDDNERQRFSSQLDLIANALYRFYNYLTTNPKK